MKRKKWLRAGALLGLSVALPLYLLAPGRPSKQKKAAFERRRFAHRGLHSADRTVPENSMAAFRRAADAGYGIELDVQLSADGHVMVFHDDTLERVCGVPGRLDWLTLEELRMLRLCGTEQVIPLLSEVLATVGGRTPLIVELKDGKRNRELCEKTLALLQSYAGDVCIESFNPWIVAWFRFHAPELLRGQLTQPASCYESKGLTRYLRFVLSHTLLNVISRPNFIACRIGPKPLGVRIAERMGAMKVGWTSRAPEDEKGTDAVIFEYYRPETVMR